MISDGARALQQALIAASNDSEARPRAVTALRGTMIWAATWPTDPATLRTLTNSNGITALAVFSNEKELEEAAIRYAWLGIDGRVPSRHLHISEVVGFARQHRAQLVVVDITSDHALELDDGDLELLSAPPSMRPSVPPTVRSSPPPAGSSAMPPLGPSRPPSYPSLAGVRATQSSASHPAVQPGATPAANGRPGSGLYASPGAHSEPVRRVAEEAAPSGQAVPHLDAMYDSLAQVLREYPEVEWGCILDHPPGDPETGPCVALRVDASFRRNVGEIARKVRKATAVYGPAHELVVLDAMEHIKHAHKVGRPFYPWRKR